MYVWLKLLVMVSPYSLMTVNPKVLLPTWRWPVNCCVARMNATSQRIRIAIPTLIPIPAPPPPIVQLKVLSDRRTEGGGIAWLVRMTPPPGKLIKIVATALSDEHIFSLQGGRSTKSGERAQGAGGYGLNPKGQPHSAMIAQETMALVIYAGEPDRIDSMEVVDIAAAA